MNGPYHLRCRWAALFRCGRYLGKCLDTLWWTLRLSITVQYRVSFGGFICFGFFVMTNVIFPFKFKIQTKILSLALIRRWLMKFSFKVTNEKRRVITIYILLPHNNFYLFKYSTCNIWGLCIIIWLKRVRWILRQIRKEKNIAK